MSKKDKKIKKLKKEVSELRAQLRKLKMASVLRRRAKVAKDPKPASRSVSKPAASPKPEPSARTDINTPAEMAVVLKSISAVRAPGQR
jgi:hypothetical protein